MLIINENGIQMKVKDTNKIRYVSPKGIRDVGIGLKYTDLINQKRGK